MTLPYNDPEYLECISDLLSHKRVCSMNQFIQHNDISCLFHCLVVSYYSYLCCKSLGLDYRAAARGGLLHDFFLYDWHEKKPYKGLHGFIHPKIALRNANKYFDLTPVEQDIISHHMWPLTILPPTTREAYIVSMVDKYCATLEVFGKELKYYPYLRQLSLQGVF